MVALYVRRINERLMTIDEVPVHWQESVKLELEKGTSAS